ncbi:MAG TPA: uroporphyrinogen decarboxylase [Candidatus Thermoplasmatota archaeon]|nr:uroporphyrinogen decarboxylase [Candidatus Thermoplasmatota archaeon]
MTFNDAILRALRREPLERTPLWLMRQAGRYLPEYRAVRKDRGFVDLMRDPKAAAEITMLPMRRFDLDAAVMFSDLTLPLLASGLDVRIEEHLGPVIRDPIRAPGDVDRLRPWRTEDALGHVLDEVKLLRSQLQVPLIAFAGGPFTLATYAIEGGGSKDQARTRIFLQQHPEAWAKLLGFFRDQVAAYLVAQHRAGAGLVQVFDSWNGALAPAAYRASVLGPTKAIFDALRREHVPSIHFGTGNPELLGLMAEAGGDAISVDWRIPLDRAWERFPGKAIQGNLEPAALCAPREAMLAQARDVLERAAGKAGHIFNLGHGVPPQASPEHVAALVDFVHAWRP